MSSVRQSTGTKGIGGKGIGGQFKAHEASEPGVTLSRTDAEPYFTFPGRSAEDRTAAQERVRARGQAHAAESFLKSFPDIVAARFVDTGSRYLTAENGMTMPNPDYVERENPSRDRRRFELRNVLLTDGTVADATNQPQYHRYGRPAQAPGDFQDAADMHFDPVDESDGHTDAFFKDHLHNQRVYFRQLIENATPRPIDVNKWGEYIDTDTREHAEAVTPDEIAAMGGKTPESALQTYADELIAEHGRGGAINMAREESYSYPGSGRYPAIVSAINSRPSRSWNPFRRR